MSAALTAAQAGKKVIMLEKMPIIGGNTNRAEGGMNAARNTSAALKTASLMTAL